MTRAGESRTHRFGRGRLGDSQLRIDFKPGPKRSTLYLVIAGKRHSIAPEQCLAIADTLRLAALSAKANRNLFRVLDLAPAATEEKTDE